MRQLELTGSEADGDPQSPEGGRATDGTGVDEGQLPKGSPSWALVRLSYALMVLDMAVRDLGGALCRPDGIPIESVRSANGRLTVLRKQTSTTGLRLELISEEAKPGPSDGYDPEDAVVISQEEWNEDADWLWP